MRPPFHPLDKLGRRFAFGLILITSIGAASGLRADQLEVSLDQILLSGDSMDLLKYADQHNNPADQEIIVKWLKGKIDAGQAVDRFIPAMIALAFH